MRTTMFLPGNRFSCFSLLLILACASLTSAQGPPRIRCPTESQGPQKLQHNTTYRFKRTATNQLCIVAKVSKNVETNVSTLSPVARSYNGHDWEPLAGENPKIDFRCNFWVCFVDMPKLDFPENEEFQIFGVYHSISEEEQVSRFLEQSTFGPTEKLISEWDYTSFTSSFARWVKQEIESTPPTQHRPFFRSASVPRFRSSDSSGRSKSPCELHSRWRQYAFTTDDRRLGKYVEVKPIGNTGTENGPFLLLVDGEVRSEVEDIELFRHGKLQPGKYELCFVLEEGIGSQYYLKANGTCRRVLQGNPRVKFTNTVPEKMVSFPPETELKTVNGDKTNGAEKVLDTDTFTHPICETFSARGSTFEVFATSDVGDWYIFDPRLVFEDNTLSTPLSDGGGKTSLLSGSLCANAPKTFLNEDSCRLSNDWTTCGPFEFDDVPILVNNNALQQFFQLSKRYYYAIGELRAEKSPCTRRSLVRWRVVDTSPESCTSSVSNTSTEETLKRLLAERDGIDKNPFVRDIQIPDDPDLKCDVQDSKAVGTRLLVGKTCYMHVHSDYFNVYDFTTWTIPSGDGGHPGNDVALSKGNPNPIEKFADSKKFVLTFPDWHPMVRWDVNKEKFGAPIARYGDNVKFQDLPDKLRLESVAEEFGAVGSSSSGAGILVCGSPGEVANVHNTKNEIEFSAVLDNNFDHTKSNFLQKKTVWALNAIFSPDQLRQRVAHALSQILAISASRIGASFETEPYLAYYDIFVRNAFGNYRDVLKEVSYSPLMSEMLTYLESKSKLYMWERTGRSDVFPDENYAREMMQLFTVGTVMLNIDGTPKLDASGDSIQAYDNDDVMDGARAWTSFLRQVGRANIEDLHGTINRVDPMRNFASWRDKFPKMLFGKYIGDGYPLCVDLPDKAFLRVGAVYRLLGASPRPELQYDDPEWALSKDTKRVILDSSKSELYSTLCNAKGTTCNFRNEVVLEENISCYGVECDVDTVRVVKVNDTFYEYKRVPCVEMSFHNQARKVKRGSRHGVMCADPRLPVATESCCPLNSLIARRNCKYIGERMSYLKASNRCVDISHEICDFSKFDSCGECCAFVGHHWSPKLCRIQAKVNSDGKIAIVHQVPDIKGHFIEMDKISRAVRPDAQNWFRVEWLKGNYSDLLDSCVEGGGEIVDPDSCLYDTTVAEESVFFARPKSIEDILSRCHVGAFDTAMFSKEDFVLADSITEETRFALVWARRNELPYDDNTIIQVTEQGKHRFFKNLRSVVKINALGGTYEFRNTPQFINLVQADRRDVDYESDAVLDQYFYHQNTAPFLATRLIQRLGISNPSPRFVKVVAQAFRSGEYVWRDTSDTGEDIRFGSNQYGDLEATIAAILLDREARSPVLDKDPGFGSLREPLLKVMHVMRAMNFEPRGGFQLHDVEAKIGQMAHEIPNVFSWFLPDFSPPGPVAAASLYSPEATILNTPNIIGLVAGLMSLIKYGLTNCDCGFGPLTGSCRNLVEGDYNKAVGNLNFAPGSLPAGEVVSKLSLLLTAGRLNQEGYNTIKSSYESQLNATTDANKEMAALRVAQQLIISAPEFHSTNLHDLSGAGRINVPSEPRSDVPYKAVVYFFLDGGCDSFNLLVPYGCQLYNEYKDLRMDIALSTNELKPIDARGSGQPCDRFGVHHHLPYLQRLYQESDALFFANTGVLFENVTVADYEEKTKTQLFAHDVQQRAVKRTDPLNTFIGTGALGRAANALSRSGYSVNAISVSSDSIVLDGEDGKVPYVNYINPGTGDVKLFNQNPSSEDILSGIRHLNNGTSLTSGFFSETWARSMNQALDENKVFSEALDGVKTTKAFPKSVAGKQFQSVAKLIKAKKQRKVDRDMFYIKLGGFDTHHNLATSLETKFTEIDQAIKSFKEEMVAQGLWDNVVIVTASEFGRTLTPNSGGGSDHGWGGNYFMAGGPVKGKRIMGKYPSNYKDLDVGRGRMIPTTSFEQYLNGVAEWLGVQSGDMDKVLPNRKKFQSNLFTKDDLFSTDS